MHFPQHIGSISALAVAALALSATPALAAPTDADTSFGRNGKALIPSPKDQDTYGVTTQPDGKVIGVGDTYAGNYDALVYRLNTDGSLDAGFGVRSLDAGSSESAQAAAVQPDGKIVVVGQTYTNHNGVVWRVNADGSPDLGFGTGGYRVIDSGGDEDLYDVAVQPDGKIVAVGGTSVGKAIAIYRLTEKGDLDPTFDGDGARGIGTGANYAAAHAVAVQPDGKIVLTGYTGAAGLTVYRLKDDGAYDPDFGGGSVTVGTGSTYPYDLVLEPDGKIVAVGEVSGPDDYDALVVRLLPSGKRDPAFRDDGTVTVDTGSDDYPHSVAIQADGKIVIGGGVEAGQDALLARLNDNGSRDADFGDNGVFTFSAGGIDYDAVMALEPDGRILLAGDNSATDSDALVFRFRGDFKDPEPDPGTGGGGEQPGGDGEQPGGNGQDPPPPPPVVMCNGVEATIVGTANADRIAGTAGRDVIAGLGGGDHITGLQGNDVVCGGKGNDDLRGGKGRDVLIGGAGHDRLIGGPGKDTTRQ